MQSLMQSLPHGRDVVSVPWDRKRDDTEGTGNVTRLTRFFTHGCRLAPLGSVEGPSAGSANPHPPHLRPLQLCLDTVVHDLDSDLTV